MTLTKKLLITSAILLGAFAAAGGLSILFQRAERIEREPVPCVERTWRAP